MAGLLLAPAGFYCFWQEQGGRLMGSLIDELQRREAAARAEAEELRGRIAELAERLAGVEERLSRLVITRETHPRRRARPGHPNHRRSRSTLGPATATHQGHRRGHRERSSVTGPTGSRNQRQTDDKRARAIVESTLTFQSISPAASASACTAANSRFASLTRGLGCHFTCRVVRMIVVEVQQGGAGLDLAP
jgi:hypothetical protein